MTPHNQPFVTPPFSVRDEASFLHWTDALPGVSAILNEEGGAQLIFRNGIPTEREAPDGTHQPMDFFAELAVHLLEPAAAVILRMQASLWLHARKAA